MKTRSWRTMTWGVESCKALFMRRLGSRDDKSLAANYWLTGKKKEEWMSFETSL